jgi:hypothetical protein
MPTLSPPPSPLSSLTFSALSPLAFTALSPPQSCSSPAPLLPPWRRWWWCGYWRADIFPANLKTADDDKPATSGHEPTWTRPLRPSREQLLHSRQRLVLLEPPIPSLYSATQSTIYSHQCGLRRHALVVHF